jgi:predicted TIM-barrel fold metal-dependent hydrolase
MMGPYDQYPLDPNRGFTHSPQVTLDRYLEMASVLGLDRMVVVQPSSYGRDHSCTFDTIDILGLHRTRGVALIDDTFDIAALREMHSRGICAARVNSVTPNSTGLDQLEAIARLIAPLGWHLEVYTDTEFFPPLTKTLLSLPVPVVIDHMGKFHVARGINGPGFQALLRLLDSEKCWVKLVGYRNSVEGPPYDDLLLPARMIIARAPDRCVWGTDWPYSRIPVRFLPDSGKLLDTLNDWAPDPCQVHKILVDNPTRLYDFPNDPQ